MYDIRLAGKTDSMSPSTKCEQVAISISLTKDDTSITYLFFGSKVAIIACFTRLKKRVSTPPIRGKKFSSMIRMFMDQLSSFSLFC